MLQGPPEPAAGWIPKGTMFNTSMNGQRKPAPLPPANTLLGPGATFRGEVHCGATSLRIEGTFEGTIHCEGQVQVIAPGVVNGTIYAGDLLVSGRVEGVFKVEGCLEIRASGWVEGEVEVGTMVVDEGGTFQGSCTRRSLKEGAEPPKPAKPAAPERPAPAPAPPTVDFTGSRGFEARKA